MHAGAGAYICGEETALLDSLEGRRGQPRLKPPFPATAGLYASPTVVNNVETIATVPAIVQGGSRWFRTMGREKSPGPKIYSLSGHVERPGQYEAPMGTTLRQLLELAGGMKDGIPLKFWTPGGSSTPLFTAEHLDVPLDFEGAAGAGLDARHHGRAAVQRDRLGAVGGHEVDRVLQARELRQVHALPGGHVLARCRSSSGWCTGEGTERDVETLLDVCDNILGRSFCALGDGAASPITSAIKYFRQEFLDLCAAQPVGRAARTSCAELAGAARMTVDARAAGTAEEKQARPLPEGHVRLTIDGREVDAPKGELIIRTCERLGIIVPRFCDHPLLDPAGACRQCLVEVEMGGRPMPKPQASCTMTVADGMVVRTQHSSPVAKKAQEGVMELLLINHPLDCPICDKGGECPLQNQAMSTGRTDSRFVDVKRTFPKPLPDLHAGAAGPRALRAVPALHPVLRADRRRPVHRPARARRAAADRCRAGQAVPVLLLRQHHPDLPGRRAHQRRVPVPGAPVRPRLHGRRRASTAPRGARSASTAAAAPPCAGSPPTTPR